MHGKNGYLITLEGIDGSGKSTLAQGIYRTLQADNIPTLLTKEPGGSPLGKTIRTILHDRPCAITPEAEFLLFAADRAQHFSEIILPALANNMIVISDRMADSSLAYQGYGRGVNKEMIRVINRWAMQGKEPDLTLFVRVPVEEALRRTRSRGEKLTSFEQEKSEFFERISHGFEEMFQELPRVFIVDGLQSPEKMLESVMQKITNRP